MAKKTIGTDSTKSGLHLKLEGQVTLMRLNQALAAWTDFLREVSRDVVGVSGRDAVRFVITDAKGGSLTLGVSPQPARKSVPVAPHAAHFQNGDWRYSFVGTNSKTPEAFYRCSPCPLARVGTIGGPGNASRQGR